MVTSRFILTDPVKYQFLIFNILTGNMNKLMTSIIAIICQGASLLQFGLRSGRKGQENKEQEEQKLRGTCFFLVIRVIAGDRKTQTYQDYHLR